MKKIALITILILSIVLRFYKLSDFPSGLNADEAALGYNAYCLLTTGMDEHGHPWPVNLESFGDFKPAGYAYLLIPVVKVLGLTEFAVRLPSALFGVLAVLFIYLLAKEIFPDKPGIALLAALLLAISPWHLHFSRGGWEVNVATTCILVGVYSFLKWVNTQQFRHLATTTFFFVSSMYIYQSARVIAPVLGLSLAILYFSKLVNFRKQLVAASVIVIVLLIPLAISILKSDAASRFSGVGLTADEGPLNRVKEFRGQHTTATGIVSKFFHNRPVIYTLQFIQNYLSHFDGNFLFVNGDIIQRSRVPETGLFYVTDFIFMSLGIFFLLRCKNQHTKIVWIWLLVSPLAAALTFQVPHALRAQNMIIPTTIILSYGFYQAINTKKIKYLIIPLLVIAYSWQVARYLHEYYVHYPQTYPAAWEYGFKQLADYVTTNRSRYKHIIITDKYDQPYILMLFYLKFPAGDFQFHHQLTLRDKFNFSTVRSFDKFQFTSTPWEKVRDIHDSLIVAAPEDIPSVGVNIVKTIFFPNGQPAFKIISN
jgi:4-amino-4-deoxy-L-arabinose transferase-like glycosyltransferase